MDVSGQLYLREKNPQHPLKRKYDFAEELNHGYSVAQL